MTIPERDIDLALTVFRTGTYDLLIKPLGGQELHCAVERAMDNRRTQSALLKAQNSAEWALDDLVQLRIVGETTSREEDLQRFLERIVASIKATLGVEIVSLMLADDTGALEIRDSNGSPDEVRKNKQILVGKRIAGHVLEHDEAVLINDLVTDGRFTPQGDAARCRTGSLLSVPIRY
jgi:transcriptional regulator with GAF, ATPase, and Fis domain